MVEDLYRAQGDYTFNRGWNPVALVAFLVPVAVNMPGFLHSAAPGAFSFISAFWIDIYRFAWFGGVGLAFTLYCLLSLRALRRRVPQSPVAA